MKSLRIPFVGLGLALCLAAGCRTPQAGQDSDTIRMTLLPSGMLQVRDDSIPAAQVPKTLHRMGATPRTILIIQIGDRTRMPEVKTLTEVLATAGYRHVYFKRPQHARTSVVP